MNRAEAEALLSDVERSHLDDATLELVFRLLSGEDADGEPVSVITPGGSFGYRAGVGDFDVDVPDGAFVLLISCVAGGADASAAIDGGDAITVPAGTALTLDDVGKVGENFNVVFAGAASFVVAWRA